jgi:hypothetical protein
MCSASMKRHQRRYGQATLLSSSRRNRRTKWHNVGPVMAIITQHWNTALISQLPHNGISWQSVTFEYLTDWQVPLSAFIALEHKPVSKLHPPRTKVINCLLNGLRHTFALHTKLGQTPCSLPVYPPTLTATGFQLWGRTNSASPLHLPLIDSQCGRWPAPMSNAISSSIACSFWTSRMSSANQ